MLQLIADLIEPYGVVNQVSSSTHHFGYPIYELKITLLMPPLQSFINDNRELRSELYLQAESIIGLLEREQYFFSRQPTIILGYNEGYITGEVNIAVYESVR
jgi:hypothetical protein